MPALRNVTLEWGQLYFTEIEDTIVSPFFRTPAELANYVLSHNGTVNSDIRPRIDDLLSKMDTIPNILNLSKENFYRLIDILRSLKRWETIQHFDIPFLTDFARFFEMLTINNFPTTDTDLAAWVEAITDIDENARAEELEIYASNSDDGSEPHSIGEALEISEPHCVDVALEIFEWAIYRSFWEISDFLFFHWFTEDWQKLRSQATRQDNMLVWLYLENLLKVGVVLLKEWKMLATDEFPLAVGTLSKEKLITVISDHDPISTLSRK